MCDDSPCDDEDSRGSGRKGVVLSLWVHEDGRYVSESLKQKEFSELPIYIFGFY